MSVCKCTISSMGGIISVLAVVSLSIGSMCVSGPVYAGNNFSVTTLAQLSQSAYHVFKASERKQYTPRGFKLLKF